jgi:hypothetical protein
VNPPPFMPGASQQSVPSRPSVPQPPPYPQPAPASPGSLHRQRENVSFVAGPYRDRGLAERMWISGRALWELQVPLGDFELIKELGKGALGSVYQARTGGLGSLLR